MQTGAGNFQSMYPKSFNKRKTKGANKWTDEDLHITMLLMVYMITHGQNILIFFTLNMYCITSKKNSIKLKVTCMHSIKYISIQDQTELITGVAGQIRREQSGKCMDEHGYI